MALLGTLIDVARSQTLAGGAFGGPQYQTVGNSLPSVPDFSWAIPQSIQNSSAPPAFGYLRGNPVGTLAVFVGSLAGASAPVVCVDSVSILAHSIIR